MVGFNSERAVAVIDRSNVVAEEREREREREDGEGDRRERETGGGGGGGQKGGEGGGGEGEEELEERILVKTSFFSLQFICHSEALCTKNLKMTHVADSCSICKFYLDKLS